MTHRGLYNLTLTPHTISSFSHIEPHPRKPKPKGLQPTKLQPVVIRLSNSKLRVKNQNFSKITLDSDMKF